jgi:hypothetical protein
MCVYTTPCLACFGLRLLDDEHLDVFVQKNKENPKRSVKRQVGVGFKLKDCVDRALYFYQQDDDLLLAAMDYVALLGGALPAENATCVGWAQKIENLYRVCMCL